MVWRLLVGAAVEVVAAAAFLAAAALIARRPVRADLLSAHRGFVVWWVGAAAYSLITAVLSVAVAQEPVRSDVALLMHTFRIVVLATAAAGLSFYVLFLYRPSPRWLLPAAGYYAALTIAIVAVAIAHGPVIFHQHALLLELHYTRPLGAVPLAVLVGLFVAPLLVGILLYLALLPRAPPAQRRRIGLVAGSLLAWIGSTIVAVWTGHGIGLFAAEIGMGVVAALAVVIAYIPDDAPG